MQTVYVGNTLINDFFLGTDKISDVLTYNDLIIEYLVVAGGGSSGVDNGGGGGAGGLLSGSLTINKNTTLQVIVGNGGLKTGTGLGTPKNGTNSVLGSIVTTGGGQGGSNFNGGEPGGSGGGGGGFSSQQGTIVGGGAGTAGPPRQGFNGGNSAAAPVGGGSMTPGGGGGAGSAGGTPTAGSGVSWVDGITYAAGGSGTGQINGTNDRGNGGSGGNNSSPVYNGGSGIVKLRYIGTGSKASGGTISYSGGYTYHTFTSSSLAGNNGTGSFIF